ncbi:MAG: hypothetical protein OEX81_04180 [Candidatus Pacebacteria bacterium]|nr:hypothetical protein [Candidatus Paceibacterota bacterium]
MIWSDKFTLSVVIITYRFHYTIGGNQMFQWILMALFNIFLAPVDIAVRALLKLALFDAVTAPFTGLMRVVDEMNYNDQAHWLVRLVYSAAFYFAVYWVVTTFIFV